LTPVAGSNVKKRTPVGGKLTNRATLMEKFFRAHLGLSDENPVRSVRKNGLEERPDEGNKRLFS